MGWQRVRHDWAAFTFTSERGKRKFMYEARFCTIKIGVWMIRLANFALEERVN